MPGGGEGEFMPGLVVRAVLGETRHEVNLHSVLIDATDEYLKPYVLGKDAEEVHKNLPANGAEWMLTFEEAWAGVSEKLMPALISGRARVWAGQGPGVPIDAQTTQGTLGSASVVGDIGTSGTTTGGSSGATPGAPAPTAKMSFVTSFTDEWVSQMLNGLVVSDHDVQNAIEDIKAQGIPGPRMMALALALVAGRIHPLGESADLRYKSDLRLCETIRKARKAGVESFDDIVKKGKRRDIGGHLTRLAKDFSDRGMIQEATLVSQFWSEASSAFEGDDSGLSDYLTEWLRKWGGRGIPKLLDTDLILRQLGGKGGSKGGGSGGGASEADVKDLKAKLEKVSSKLNESNQAQAALLKRVTRAEARAESSKESTGAKKCFICGGDHLARDCPDKDKGKGKGKAVVIDVTEEE
jgi:hypothetical protein